MRTAFGLVLDICLKKGILGQLAQGAVSDLPIVGHWLNWDPGLFIDAK